MSNIAFITIPRQKSRFRALFSLLMVIALTTLSSCQWIAVTYNAIGYPTTERGEYANVAVAETTAYATLAEDGLEVVDLRDPQRRVKILPPVGSGSIDDIAIADGFLFLLDAREPGYLSVFSLGNSTPPVLSSGPVTVPVGPFSGVSAGNGKVVVSGGTSSMTQFDYDLDGKLSSVVATIDLGRGQPDVLVAPDGKRAFVSTHYIGPYFGLTAINIGGDSAVFVKRGDVELDTFGFTDGGAKPANFPIEAALKENIVFVAHSSGLAVISVENIEQPKLLRTVDVGVKAVNVDVAGDIAAVVGSSPDPLLVLLDVSDPQAPVLKHTVKLPEDSYATSVAIGTEHIIVATQKHGLLIFPTPTMVTTTRKEL
ncbi:MAG: hypothetical protein L0Y80_07335 [Ignavibacteriae bacterium]|nr:hypothetical protein [Ignavibacteriota bacterium]